MNAAGAPIETFAPQSVIGVYFYPNVDSVEETNHRRGMVSGESPEPATRWLHETPRPEPRWYRLDELFPEHALSSPTEAEEETLP